uniref:HAT C-terminal dimerisation domain-containing protein n=1 Tax=Globodera rostochiensis TaxID=31243 RepID=A0A914H766_GLORO
MNNRIHAVVIRYFDGTVKNKVLKLVPMIAENAISISNMLQTSCTDAPDELDNLFDEVVELKDVIRELEATEGFSKKNLEKKWGEVLKDKNLKHIKSLVSIFLSIFPSNAFCESVFSVVNHIWTDQSNQFSPETVNAFVCVKLNSDLDCNSAYDFFLSQNELLNAAKGFEKYGRTQ